MYGSTLKLERYYYSVISLDQTGFFLFSFIGSSSRLEAYLVQMLAFTSIVLRQIRRKMLIPKSLFSDLGQNQRASLLPKKCIGFIPLMGSRFHLASLVLLPFLEVSEQ